MYQDKNERDVWICHQLYFPHALWITLTIWNSRRHPVFLQSSWNKKNTHKKHLRGFLSVASLTLLHLGCFSILKRVLKEVMFSHNRAPWLLSHAITWPCHTHIPFILSSPLHLHLPKGKTQSSGPTSMSCHTSFSLKGEGGLECDVGAASNIYITAAHKCSSTRTLCTSIRKQSPKRFLLL